ncbi:HEAT repeat domain-containing protein [Sediminicola luteus]|uniref:Anti-sigma factor n=1 Tax=Sediminicola luteus TaxID=319238 RepID=A0A2A4G8B6_9FLAO|nr:HEAT repeat domain-containing protein [Sediminicola luteus]PCE64214.1 hypothetical protein B7P33_07880 [Sediminicola luteus]
MTEKEFLEVREAYVLGELSASENQACNSFLERHPQHQEEVDRYARLLDRLNEMEIPEPSSQMDERFYAALRKEQSEVKPSIWQRLETFVYQSWVKQLAFGLVVLVAGFLLGKQYETMPSADLVQQQTESNADHSQMLALLEDDMASNRLAALEAIGRLQKADAIVVKALFTTLNNDSNTNVRLAALEALMPFAHKPEVREGLVYAMASQEDAMVQISLAETLLQIQAKEAVPVLQDIIRSDHINAVAKEKMEETVAQLVM